MTPFSIGRPLAWRAAVCLAVLGTLLIAAAADAQSLTIAKAFSGPTMPLNGTTTLTFTLESTNEVSTDSIAFTDTLPAGLKIATPNGLIGSCGGTVTAAQDTTVIELADGTLGPGASCQFSVTVTATLVGPKFNQTSTVTYDEESSIDGASASITVVAPPTITKAFGAPSILLNGTTTLTITVANPNEENELTGLAFTDTLPPGLVVDTPNGLTTTCTGTVAALAGGGTVSLTTGTLLAGTSCTITVTVRGGTHGVKDNTTGPISSTEGGPGAASQASLTVIAPGTILKQFGATNILLNGTTTLTFTISNPAGNVTLTALAFTDALPAGLVVATPNGLSTTCTGTVTATPGTGTVALLNGSLPEGAYCTITVTVRGTTAGLKNNTTGPLGSAQAAAGAASLANLAVVAPPTIAKAFGATTVGLGGVTTLTFTLTNPAGNGATFTGLTFTDTLPAGLVVATPNGLTGSCGGGAITAIPGSNSVNLSGGSLNPGTSCVFSVNVLAVAGGVQPNTTSDLTGSMGAAASPATASITVLAPDLRIAKSHTGTFTAGQPASYTITVTNLGPGSTVGTVTVTDTLPAGLTATAMTGPGWACSVATVSCTRSDALASGASYPPITLTVNVAASATGSLVNTAVVSGGGDTNPANNTATDTTSLEAAAIPALSTYAQALFVVIVLLGGLLALRRRNAITR